MRKKKDAKNNQQFDQEIAEKLDVIMRLLGLAVTQKDLPSLSQGDQIILMNKAGLRNKDIAGIFGIKSQQVTNALSKAKKKKKRK